MCIKLTMTNLFDFINKISRRKNYIIFTMILYLIIFFIIRGYSDFLMNWWINVFNKIIKEKNAFLMYFEFSYFIMLTIYIPLSLLTPLKFLENKYNLEGRINFSSIKFDKRNKKEFLKGLLAFIFFPILILMLILVYFLLKIIVSFFGIIGGILIAIFLPVSLFYLLYLKIRKRK